MTIEEIVRGESKNVEFKLMLPKGSEKYTKTIVAFANTQGGQLIIGVDDETRNVVGVDNELVFRVMDSIANAVSDSCAPQIVPDITFQTIDGKTVVVASVTPGANRPYYLKSKGKEKGTYVRVAGTSQLADSEKIRELEYEGTRISWDELTCFTATCHWWQNNGVSKKHRRSIGEASEKHRSANGVELSDTQRKILGLLSKDARLSAAKLAEQIGITSRNIESNIKKLKERGFLIRHGSPKSGYWEIVKK